MDKCGSRPCCNGGKADVLEKLSRIEIDLVKHLDRFLSELDGIGGQNDGVFVLAATNHPWDVDEALLRPGRFDRRPPVASVAPSARMSPR